jgi:CelD/BcsL family acetyltransferase involved in cellulose biosynthesis
LKGIPADSATIRMIDRARPQVGFRQGISDTCYSTSLPENFDYYFQSLSCNFRKNMRNGESRLKRKGLRVNFAICTDKSEIHKIMNSFAELHKKRWQTKQEQSSLIKDSKAMDFYTDIAISFLQKGWLALNYLTINDTPVAVGFDFAYRQKLYSYLSGFDPEFDLYGVGHLRNKYLIKDAIEKGLTEIDFMRGAESYKQRWNAVAKTTMRIEKMRSPIIQLVSDFYHILQKLGIALSTS